MLYFVRQRDILDLLQRKSGKQYTLDTYDSLDKKLVKVEVFYTNLNFDVVTQRQAITVS